MSATSQQNWKNKFLISGAVIGALAGLGTAYLLARTSEEKGGGPPQIQTVDALRASVGVIGVVRAIAALGDK